MNILKKIHDVELIQTGYEDFYADEEKYLEIAEQFAIEFSNWLDKNYIKKKEAYFHKGDWELSNGERDKRKLLKIFQLKDNQSN